MKNKKKKLLIIIISGVVLVIIILIVVILLWIRNNNVLRREVDERFTELINNNYLYYYYLYGDIEVGAGSVVENDIEYYIVRDETIKNIGNIMNLADDTFINPNIDEATETNQYLIVGDTLYVNKIENVCQNIKEFNLNELNYEYNPERIEILFDDISAFIGYKDDKWKLYNNVYFCTDDIENNNTES